MDRAWLPSCNIFLGVVIVNSLLFFNKLYLMLINIVIFMQLNIFITNSSLMIIVDMSHALGKNVFKYACLCLHVIISSTFDCFLYLTKIRFLFQEKKDLLLVLIPSGSIMLIIALIFFLLIFLSLCTCKFFVNKYKQANYTHTRARCQFDQFRVIMTSKRWASRVLVVEKSRASNLGDFSSNDNLLWMLFTLD